jgi:hypothetical protein
MLIIEALNYSDDGEDGSKDFFVASKEVLGDGSVEAFNGRDNVLMRCFYVVRK